MAKQEKKNDPLLEEDKETKEVKVPVIQKGTDGKVTMIKAGVGRRYHVTKVAEMEAQGWELVG